MANIRSQIKRNRTNERRRQRNRAVKTALSTAGTEGAGDEALRLALKKIDKAASKGVIHKNAAARRKSRLVRAVARSAS